MLINGKRALAYISEISKLEPIEGADRIELATVEGWTVIVRKGEFQLGDKCVFFEIDAKLPQTVWSEFLAPKGYKVKTMKLTKFGVWSQGLALPISAIFGEGKSLPMHTDLTKELDVTYYNAEDNDRKEDDAKKRAFISMEARHKERFQKQPYKWLLKRDWGRKLLFAIFGRKKDSKKGFPAFVKKTDEERIELLPHLLGQKTIWEAYEKLDGTSATYALQRKKFGGYEFYVCSRNVRQLSEDQKCAHTRNVYWDMEKKYDIKAHLQSYLSATKFDWVAVQGEIVGDTQGNPLQLKETDLYLFNFITPNGRKSSREGARIASNFGMKWVPYLFTCALPDNMEEMKQWAEGKSVVNPEVDREGLVFRTLDGKQSFKNVARSYLLKH